MTTCALAVSPSLTAVAAESGVVNLYRNSAAATPNAQRSPWKALLNLTTAVETAVFNHDSSILLLASRFNKNAVRLVSVDFHVRLSRYDIFLFFPS